MTSMRPWDGNKLEKHLRGRSKNFDFGEGFVL